MHCAATPTPTSCCQATDDPRCNPPNIPSLLVDPLAPRTKEEIL